MTRSRGGSFTTQPRIEAFSGDRLPPLRPSRKTPRPDLLERHTPSAWDPARCAFCGFAWDGHPASVRSPAPSSPAPGVA